MQEDNLYPADGSYYTLNEPVEQTVARKKKKAQTLEALPILKVLLDRLDKQIKVLESIDGIPDEVKIDPQQFLVVYNANKLARDILRVEKEYIEGLVSDYHGR
ncbi:MAG: hypothetical protein U1C12_00175 [Patescibacteria group bacterium]|nr:hypothetical protein [Patescibacteria group bacterium]